MHSRRHTSASNLLHEARLCRMAPNAPSASVSSAPQNPNEAFLNEIIESGKKAGVVIGNAAESIKLYLIEVPLNFMEGIAKQWGLNFPSLEEVKAFCTNTKNFLRDVPVVGSIINRLSNVSYETAKNLTSHEQWVSAFTDPSFDFDGKIVPLPAGAALYGPLQLLNSMAPAQRKQAYLDYVRGFVSVPVQQKMFSSPLDSLDPATKFDSVIAQKDIVNGVFKGTLGMESDPSKLPGNSASLAKENLEYQYDLAAAEPTKGLVGDYQTALRYQAQSGNLAIATDPTILADKLPASRMKGALLLGALDTAQLTKLNDVVQKIEQEKLVAKAEIHGNIDTLKNTTNDKLKQNAEGLKETFNGLGGWEKFALIALVGVALFKSSKARGVAMALGGAYLFQRVVLKDQNPLKTWKEMFTGTTAYAKNMIGMKETADSEAYVNFLSEYDRSQLELQGTAYGTLSGVDMSVLASSLSMDFTGSSTRPFDMKIGTGSDLDKRLVANGATEKERAFLRKPENTKATGDAISFIFYSMASKNPASSSDVQLVEEASRFLKPHDSPADLFGREGETDDVRRQLFKDASAAYLRVVVRGRDMALNSVDTLGSYVSKNAIQPLQPVSTPASVPAQNQVANAGPVQPGPNPAQNPNAASNTVHNAQNPSISNNNVNNAQNPNITNNTVNNAQNPNGANGNINNPVNPAIQQTPNVNPSANPNVVQNPAVGAPVNPVAGQNAMPSQPALPNPPRP